MRVQVRPRGAASVKLRFIPGIQGPVGPTGPAALPVASQTEAEAGTATDKSMTPQRTQQAIAALSYDRAASDGRFAPIAVDARTTFAINATTNLYVDPVNGLDTNAGTSLAVPFQTVQAAVNFIGQYPILNGTWKINLAAGNYAGFTFPTFLWGRSRVQILGPSAAYGVPTAIINSGSVGINIQAGNNVYVRDVKVSGVATGISASDSDLYCDNVHLFGFTDGLIASRCRLRFSGGIVDGNNSASATGLECIAGTTYTIGYNYGGSVPGTTIQNCGLRGVLVQEMANGHVDHSTLTNNAIGIDLTVLARCHVLGSSFTVNSGQTGIRATYNSVWINSGDPVNNPNTWTVNAAGTAWKNYAGSLECNETGTSVVERRGYVNTTGATLTGTSTATALITATAFLEKMNFYWSGRRLRIRLSGTLTGTAGNKIVTIKFAGANLFSVTIPAAYTGAWVGEFRVTALASNSQRYSGRVEVNGSSPLIVNGTASIGLLDSNAYDVTVQAQLAATADTLAISDMEIWETA